MPTLDEIRRRLEAAVAEARRVGDSPLRADQLADRLGELLRAVPTLEAPEDTRNRIRSALTDAERVLRRDDDGHEAARHIQTALRASEWKAAKPSPFLD
jgi:type VI protein secretion system component VasF